MKKKIAIFLCCLLCISNTMTIFAGDYTTATDAEVPLAFSKNSYFTVTLPETISGEKGVKTINFDYSVEGDIASNEKVTVNPVDNNLNVSGAQLELSDTTGETMDANVSIPKTDFYYDEIWEKNTQQGTVSVDELPAGTWDGVAEFLINLEQVDSNGESSEGSSQSRLSLSEDDLIMGTSASVQVNAYIDGELANDSVTWSSDNENITVTDGLVETKASAQVGDVATVTVSVDDEENSAEEVVYNLTKLASSVKGTSVLSASSYLVASDVNDTDISTASFTVTIIDMAYTATGEDTTLTSLNLEPGESSDVEVSIIPASATSTVTWSTTAPAGLNMVINGNTVTLKVASDMPTGNSYDLIATCGNFSKLLKVNIVSDSHTHSYTESITKAATCTEDGEKTFTCSCGNTYTEVISATGHNYENGVCTECGESEPVTLEAGLYDANDNMLCSWEDSGIDVETVYTASNCKTSKTSAYYVIENTYSETVKIILPDTITSIGDWGFYACDTLTSIEIPDSVTSIGTNAFRETSINSIVIPDGVTTIGVATFSSCTDLKSVKLPDSITIIDDTAFGNCSSLSDIIIPSNVTEIGDNAFNGCTSLVNVVIPDSVTSIGTFAFSKCTSLIDVVISDNITEIGNYMFNGCTSLTSVVIPSSVTEIGNYAFYGCTSLADVTISNNVTEIGNYTFKGCTSLTSVVIPSSVISIGCKAFEDSSLSDAIFETTTGWYVGSSAGKKTTSINSTYLSNTSTAATYLKTTYVSKYWTHN